jgi:hypothetical protein
MAENSNGEPRGTSAEPGVEVTLTIKLTGPLANAEDIGEIAAALDGLMAERYPEIYKGPSIRLTTEPMNVPRMTRQG